jgi:hypothetical protein
MARVLGVSEGYLLGTTDSPEPDVYIANAKFKALPIVGEIACGTPVFANEEDDGLVYTDADTDADFCLIAKGDSMKDARIYDGDIVFVRRQEIVDEGENLAMEYDPKCAWALKNMHLFPVEINRAPLEMLLRVPGIGAKNAYKILEARKYNTLTFESLTKMRIALKRAKHFITCNGKFFGAKNEHAVRGLLCAAETQESAEQLSLFGMQSTPQNALIALHGQL